LPHVNCYPAAEELRVVGKMARQLSMATRRELKDAIRERYQAAGERRQRRQILAEFVRVTGYHRKHALAC
jgi:hypothetical protein